MRILLPFLAAATLLFTGCFDTLEGTGEVINEDRVVEPFKVIDTRCSANVEIRQIAEGEQPKVVVTAQENLLPHIHTRVESDRLVIDVEGSISTSEGLKVLVLTPVIEKIVQDGSGDVESLSPIRTNELELVHKGSGDLMVSYTGDLIELDHDGSGDVRLIGASRELEVKADGSGDVHAFELRANEVEVSSDGSVNVHVSVEDILSVELTGSGNVTYKGDPQEMETSNRGSGKIERD